jgi:hypothetical protein
VQTEQAPRVSQAVVPRWGGARRRFRRVESVEFAKTSLRSLACSRDSAAAPPIQALSQGALGERTWNLQHYPNPIGRYNFGTSRQQFHESNYDDVTYVEYHSVFPVELQSRLHERCAELLFARGVMW